MKITPKTPFIKPKLELTRSINAIEKRTMEVALIKPNTIKAEKRTAEMSTRRYLNQFDPSVQQLLEEHGHQCCFYLRIQGDKPFTAFAVNFLPEGICAIWDKRTFETGMVPSDAFTINRDNIFWLVNFFLKNQSKEIVEYLYTLAKLEWSSHHIVSNELKEALGNAERLWCSLNYYKSGMIGEAKHFTCKGFKDHDYEIKPKSEFKSLHPSDKTFTELFLPEK